MKPSAKNKLAKILSDNKSGSTEILINLIKWNLANLNDEKALRNMIVSASKELKTFSNVQSFLKEFKTLLKKYDLDKIKDFLNEQLISIKNRYDNLFHNSLTYLKDVKRIVTISNSKTISEGLKKLNRHHKIFVTIGESRPQLEGRILAKELIRNSIKVEIISDALLSSAVENCDAVIIGADSILTNENVVNKIGSKGLAIACEYFNKPLYVLATKDKFSNKKKFIPGKGSENEIWNYNNIFLTKTNFYFEVIDRDLITRIITD